MIETLMMRGAITRIINVKGESTQYTSLDELDDGLDVKDITISFQKG